ncbi:polygalacturonase inhibitor-like [Momordica charantia]|uniref:Pgip1 n=1 Tax=Momordica charantia TaxID=3673 RepID=A0A1W6IYG8_MOMCH|nr:polygalacturonase inhibitor-like [Momordica charantia]ARM53420.1 pgip1 [Momordica charantia]
MAAPKLTFFFLLFISSSICFAELCNPNDKKVLLKIKKSFNNPYILTSWKPEEDCCSWYCVQCHPTSHRIISLTIFADDKLSGQIPPVVGDLPFLETLMLHKLPNLTGPIPAAVANLHNLKSLDLSWNGLSGPVPEFLGSLSSLTYLDLSFNNLTGSIPSSLANLQRLGALHLDRNKLTGPIPHSFGYFKGKIPYLYLSHNQLSGKIPASLGRVNFNVIDLSRNKLEGDASVIFGGNKTTEIVDLSRNLLEFDLSKVVFPRSVTWLDLNHNKIFGGIPEKVVELELQLLNVSYNRLCGRIPVGGRLQRFDVYEYFHNKCLCGKPLGSCK